MQRVNPEPRVLCIDDEVSILKALSRLLTKVGCDVMTAQSADEGLAIATQHELDVVVCDMRMPGKNGAEFFTALFQSHPDVYRILLTGQSDMNSTISAINDGHIHNYVNKPWDNRQLATLVRSGAEQTRLKRENERLTTQIKKQNTKLSEANAILDEAVKKRTKQLRNALDKIKAGVKRDWRLHQGALRTLYNAIIVNPELDGRFARDVSNLAEQLSSALNCPTDMQRDISYAALICQIGMLGLPAELRVKPYYKMQNAERDRFAQHPHIAEQILSPATHLANVTAIIAHQRYRYGGSEGGGHQSLIGEDIPLGARILAVARDFVAYKKGLILHQALDDKEAEHMIQLHRGTWYDPRVVDALQTIVERDKLAPELIEGEQIVAIEDIRPGMILTRNLYASNNLLLLPKEHVFTEETIAKLLISKQKTSAEFEIYIDSQSMTQS